MHDLKCFSTSDNRQINPPIQIIPEEVQLLQNSPTALENCSAVEHVMSLKIKESFQRF